MDTTSQDTTETPKSAALLPEIDYQFSQIEDQDLQNLGTFVGLTAKQRTLAVALVDNTFSEDNQTDEEICRRVGISHEGLRLNRRNAGFVKAMGALLMLVMRGNTDQAVATVYRGALKDPKTAIDYLKISGFYIPKAQNVNINAQVGTVNRQGGSITESKDTLLTRMGELGWSLDRVEEFATSIPARFEELRAEGAF